MLPLSRHGARGQLGAPGEGQQGGQPQVHSGQLTSASTLVVSAWAIPLAGVERGRGCVPPLHFTKVVTLVLTWLRLVASNFKVDPKCHSSSIGLSWTWMSVTQLLE